MPGDDYFLLVVVATLINDAAAETRDPGFVVANAVDSDTLRCEVVNTAFGAAWKSVEGSVEGWEVGGCEGGKGCEGEQNSELHVGQQLS